MTRKKIPEATKRALLEEAGWRCAIVTCRSTSSLEFAHIHPVGKNGDNDFFNLIVLCSNCHGRFDNKNEKYMNLQAMINLKKNLMVLNGRYNSFELRIMEYFLNNPKQDSVLLFGRELDVMYLVNDELIEEGRNKFANAINFPPKKYILTEKGKDFIDRWKTAKLLDESLD